MLHFTESKLRLVKEMLVPYRNTVASSRTPASARHLVKDYDQRVKRKASVLVPLANVNGEAAIIYTLRSNLVATHKSQVSFPGGQTESGETNGA